MAVGGLSTSPCVGWLRRDLLIDMTMKSLGRGHQAVDLSAKAAILSAGFFLCFGS